jgi:O-antigen ligase
MSAGIIGKNMIIQRWEATLYYMKVRQTEVEAIGARFLLWEAALKMWSRNPVLGTGLGDFHHDIEEMSFRGEIEIPDLSRIAHTYAHSIFFEFLACAGIIGLLAMVVSTIVIPLIFFYKNTGPFIINWNLYAKIFGIVFVVTFSIFGLTENWLAHKQLVMTYSLILAIMGSRFALR